MGGELEEFEAGGELQKAEPVKRKSGAHHNQGVLETPWTRNRLVRELAVGEVPQTVLARRYGVETSKIREFRDRHAGLIEQCAASMADEYAHLWVANKGNRLAAYQDSAEKMAAGSSPRHQEVLTNVLKAVADELGDLPQRTQVQVNNTEVRYEVHGVDPELLR